MTNYFSPNMFSQHLQREKTERQQTFKLRQVQKVTIANDHRTTFSQYMMSKGNTFK